MMPSEDAVVPTDNFEYDVAFSFHSLDENIAFEINDRLQDRYRTFLYSEKQNDLAGRNGEARNLCAKIYFGSQNGAGRDD